ncbi:MAG: ATP-binding protein [Cyanobacteria bacterium P01_G01_bin.54]
MASEKSKRLSFLANLGAVAITFSLVVVIGLLFQRYLKANQKIHHLVMDEMRRREQGLEQERQVLEDKVRERTQALQQANTELANALTELEQSQVQVIQNEKMSMLGQLVAGIAHEINNPVGFIAGNIQPALDYVQDLFGLIDLYQKYYPEPSVDIQAEIESIDLAYIQDDLPKLIGSIQEGATRIQDISTGLRTFSRGDNASPIAFNLHDGIDSTVMILKHRLKANETRPEIEVIKNYGELPAIECYAGQLNQVFMNILANAIDAVESSNQSRGFDEIKANPNQIKITTSLDHEMQLAIVQIKDNGVGIADEVQNKIFDHLFTTKAVGSGTGLGLSISRQIVIDKHHGSLTVDSKLGEGTEFTIAIPMRSNSDC